MLTLTGLGVRNLRSLKDTGIVALKPITILVGKNSAGKSSFARLLPLLKQSAERRKESPILWFGRLVDFGSFAEAVSSFASQKRIELLLQFACPPVLGIGRRTYYTSEPPSDELTSHLEVRLHLGDDPDTGRTLLHELSMDIFGSRVSIGFKSSSFEVSIDDLPMTLSRDTHYPIWIQGAILPQLRLVQKDKPSSSAVPDSALFAQATTERIGTQVMRNAITTFVHGNTADSSKDDIADRLPLASADDLLRQCRQLPQAPDTWKFTMSTVKAPTDERFLKLKRGLVLYKLELLLSELDDALQQVCSGISYLEPLRATAQRYYRREDVSIDGIDPKGLNIAFFVHGLSRRDRDSLNMWLDHTLGFTLDVESSGGHVSLRIHTQTDLAGRNMADVGLGYSQLAPVAIQMWSSMRKVQPLAMRRTRFFSYTRKVSLPSSLLVVEQPELHLHPAYQAKLGEVFARCALGADPSLPDERRLPVTIIAETHSPNLINRLGELVGAGQLSPDSVQIVIFEPNEKRPVESSVRISTFSPDGILQNWPLGFFDY